MAKQTAKINIIKFLTGDGILLSSVEEKILARWEYANDLLTAKKLSWADIRDKIALKFVVSRFTAENDIVNAQEVYGHNRRINKKYLLHLHIERLDQTIEIYKNELFKKGKDKHGNVVQNIPEAKEAMALAKLSESYTYAVNSAPADIDTTLLPPPIFVFKLPVGVNLPLPPLPQLTQAVDEYLEYTMLNNGQQDIQPARPANPGKGDADPSHDD